MIRKLIIKRTMSPILAKKRTFICNEDKNKQISTMEHRQAVKDKKLNYSINDFSLFFCRTIIYYQRSS
jgi:hypothetical protein